MQIVNAEIEAGRGGKSMFDAIKEKAWYGVASAIGTYFGFNDLIRYGISTDGLATALKDSASALVTANNDLNEAVSLTTAGNAITQDPSKVGAGLRTISLRLVGTEEAKEELSDLGEETDGMITTVSKLRNTIQSATSAATKDGKGFDIFDSNGNYKSTIDKKEKNEMAYKEKDIITSYW